jgi:hypothetical protein
MSRIVRYALSLFVLVVLFIPAVHAQQKEAGVPRPQQRHPFADHDAIRALPLAEAKAVHGELSANERQEVWTAHLVAFLAEHPELNDEQRDVVYQAMGVLATGIFTIDRANARWQTDVEAPLSRAMARAKLVMPRHLVAAAFYTLSDDNGGRKRSGLHGGLRMTSNVVDCECSTQDSWCVDPQVCQGRRPGFCTPVPSYNCGPFFTFACDGMCV